MLMSLVNNYFKSTYTLKTTNGLNILYFASEIFALHTLHVKCMKN